MAMAPDWRAVSVRIAWDCETPLPERIANAATSEIAVTMTVAQNHKNIFKKRL
jgi:hypothetical protein